MIFPTTYLASLLLLIVSAVCLGLWAFLQKLTFKWRFELLFYDVCFGMALVAIAAAFTFGSMNQQELTFQDNLLLVGYRKMAWALASGAVFALGAILLLGATVASRVAVAFPVAYGLWLAIGVGWDFATRTQGNSVLTFSGAALLLATVALAALGYAWYKIDIQAEAQKAFIADPRTKAPPRESSPSVGIVLGAFAGILFAIANPMLEEATVGEGGISAYGGFLLFTVGFFLASQLYIPFFMNFPVVGEPVQLRQYFKGTQKSHLLGLTAGMLLGGGILAVLVAAGAVPSVRVSPMMTYLLTAAPGVVAALLGLVVWREFKGASSRVQMVLLASVVLFLAGAAVVAIGRTA